MKNAKLLRLAFIFLLSACGTAKFDETKTVRTLSKEYVGLKKMILMEGGTFLMGSNAGKSYEKPVHEVFLDPFYMDETPVTFGDYEKYIKAGGCVSFFDRSYRSSSFPLVGVTWHMAADFCNWRSKYEGFRPAYVETSLLDAWGYPIYELDRTSDGYRLPTEAEFEFAARGGLSKKNYPWGDYFADEKANIDTERGVPGSSRLRLTKVKDHKPNGYGLYDMCGNVWEWCNDWFSEEYYQYSPEKNPAGEMSGRCKVLRGGSWGTTLAERATVYARSWAAPSNYNYDIGFRCVRPAVPSARNTPAATEHDFYFPDFKPHLSPVLDYASPNFALRLAAFIRENYHNSLYFHQAVDGQKMLTPEEMADLILEVCLSKQINPAFLTGIMAAESGFGVCSIPRWYNNPMAFRWQNVLMKNGPPVYEDLPYKRNRRFRTLKDGFEAFCEGLRRHAYTDAAHKDLYDFHIVYVGYEAKEWIYIVRKVYRDLLREEIDVHFPDEEIGKFIYLDWENIRENTQITREKFLENQKNKLPKNIAELEPKKNHFYLICGSYETYDEAYRVKISMIKRGYSKAKILLGGTVFRVSVADSPKHDEITELQNKMKKDFGVLWVWKN
jgi:formylglycine-generating enzyme required for sulfatase activity